MNENPITKVFVAPSKIRNPFLFVFEIRFPIIAACPEPRPGRKLQRGEAIKDPKKGLKIFALGFDIFWLGMMVLFFILKSNIDPPNKPVSKGRRGCLSEGRFRTISPNAPVKRKTNRALSFFLSRKIKRRETAIRTRGMTKGFVRRV